MVLNGLHITGLIALVLLSVRRGEAKQAFACFERSDYNNPGPQPTLLCGEGEHIQVTNYRFVYEPKGCETHTPSSNNNCAKSSSTLLAANIKECNGKRSCTSTYSFGGSIDREVLPAVTSSCRIDGSLSSGSGGWSGVTVDYECERLEFCNTFDGRYVSPVLRTQNYPEQTELNTICKCEIWLEAVHYQFVPEMKCNSKLDVTLTGRDNTAIERTCKGGSDELVFEAMKNATFKLRNVDSIDAKGAFSLKFNVFDEKTQDIKNDQPVHIKCTGTEGVITPRDIALIAGGCAVAVLMIIAVCIYCQCRHKCRKRRVEKRWRERLAKEEAEASVGMPLTSTSDSIHDNLESDGIAAVHYSSHRRVSLKEKSSPGKRHDPDGDDTKKQKEKSVGSDDETLNSYAAQILAKNKQREAEKLAKRAAYNNGGTLPNATAASRSGSMGRLSRGASASHLLNASSPKAQEAAQLEKEQEAAAANRDDGQEREETHTKPPKYCKSMPQFPRTASTGNALSQSQHTKSAHRAFPSASTPHSPTHQRTMNYNKPFPHGYVPNYHGDNPKNDNFNPDDPPPDDYEDGGRMDMEREDLPLGPPHRRADPYSMRAAASMPGTPGGRYGLQRYPEVMMSYPDPRFDLRAFASGYGPGYPPAGYHDNMYPGNGYPVDPTAYGEGGFENGSSLPHYPGVHGGSYEEVNRNYGDDGQMVNTDENFIENENDGLPMAAPGKYGDGGSSDEEDNRNRSPNEEDGGDEEDLNFPSGAEKGGPYFQGAMHPTGEERGAGHPHDGAYDREGMEGRLNPATSVPVSRKASYGDPFDSPAMSPYLPGSSPHRQPMGYYTQGRPHGPYGGYRGGPSPGVFGHPAGLHHHSLAVPFGAPGQAAYAPFMGAGPMMAGGGYAYPGGYHDEGLMMHGPPADRHQVAKQWQRSGSRDRQASQPNLTRAGRDRAPDNAYYSKGASGAKTMNRYTKSQPASPSAARRFMVDERRKERAEVDERFRRADREPSQRQYAASNDTAPRPIPKSRSGSLTSKRPNAMSLQKGPSGRPSIAPPPQPLSRTASSGRSPGGPSYSDRPAVPTKPKSLRGGSARVGGFAGSKVKGKY